jgi:hypothetical protein
VLFRGDDPPQTPPALGGTARPPKPPGPPLGGTVRPWGADRAVEGGVGGVNEPALYLKFPAGEQIEGSLLAVVIVWSGSLRLKHG